MEDINVHQLKEKLERGEKVILIDVREPHEHEEFNIGGELIPLGELPGALPELNPHREAELVMYCRSGQRSATAKNLLLQAGFKQVRNLTGGMLAWKDAFEPDQR